MRADLIDEVGASMDICPLALSGQALMKPLPCTPDLIAVAPRVLWFEAPEKALADPIHSWPIS